MTLETHTLTTPDGLPLNVDLRADPDRTPKALVVIVHGFKGFRRWGFFPHTAEQIARAGYATAVLDFSMNGIGDDPVEFSRLDLFERNTLSREVTDLEQAIDWLRGDAPVADSVKSKPLGVLGHSRGAVATLAVAADRPDSVGAVVTWNGVSRALRYTEGQLARWEEDEEMAFTNARTGQRMTMSWDYVVDAREHAARIEPTKSAARTKAPHLILHGSKDMAVSPDEARALLEAHGPDDVCALVEIDDGTHTFGAVHPFAGTTPQLDRALEATVSWFDTHLVREDA